MKDYLGVLTDFVGKNAIDGLPVFQVNDRGEFWCIPGCGKKHKHGAEGHRLAHCDRKNKNAWKSYYIQKESA